MLLLARYIAVLCVAASATHLKRFLAAAGSFAAVGAEQSNLRHASRRPPLVRCLSAQLFLAFMFLKIVEFKPYIYAIKMLHMHDD